MSDRIYFILKMTSIGILVTFLGGLVGWYVFLKTTQNAVEQKNALLGISPPPSATNPFGSSAFSTIALQHSSSTSPTQKPRVWHIETEPTAGFGFSSSTLVYILRSNGNIYSSDFVQYSSSRISDALFPKIYEATVGTKGTIILRSLTDSWGITSYVGSVATTSRTTFDGPTSTPTTLTGAYNFPGATSVWIASSTPTILLTRPNTKGGTDIISTQPESVSQTLVASMPGKSWRLLPIKGDTPYVQHASSDTVEGFVYAIKKNTLTPFARALQGLMVSPSPYSASYLLSQSTGGVLLLTYVSNTVHYRVPLSTFAEKCVWSPTEVDVAYCATPNALPSNNPVTNWYKGILHTQDTWWRVDSGTTTKIYDPRSDNLSWDVVDPQIDPTGQFIIFRNHLDESLWSLHIGQ